MRLTTASRMQVVKKEEKEARARQLIETSLAKRAHGTAGEAAPVFLLVARSAESPVVRAIATLAADIRAAGIEVMAVLCQHEAGDAASTLLAAGHQLRILSDARFLEAHEQLVLGGSAVWIGDCMRRDPVRRDAWECHAEDATEIADWAHTSFLRLWRMATAIEAPVADLTVPDRGGGVMAVPAGESETPLVASTRH